jgi:pimeloyl-ACP methyl ester carboxylesterase
MDTVILLPGVWMPAWSLLLLDWRLRRAGFRVRRFHYASLRGSLAGNARRLHEFAARQPAGRIHFVGHSLGGMVVQALFHYYPDQAPGRVVSLGSPHRGSRAAQLLAGRAWGRRLLGRPLRELVRQEGPAWPLPAREWGVIAGERGLGLGCLLVPGLPRPHDGTVSVAETRPRGAHDHLVLPVTHTQMLVSSAVAGAVVHYLRYGRFPPTPG